MEDEAIERVRNSEKKRILNNSKRFRDFKMGNNYGCPCHGCVERELTCHSTCAKYIEWTRSRVTKKDIIRVVGLGPKTRYIWGVYQKSGYAGKVKLRR